VLDDLHWATSPTLAMLQHALRDADLGKVFVFGTYRDTDVDRRHPLVDVRANLERMSGVEHLELRGLDELQVCVLLAATAGQPIDERMSALGRVVADQTNGNPFFVGQVLRHLTEQGRLVHRDDRWFLEGELEDLGLPRAVQTLVQHRVGRLSDAAIETLHTAAAIGRQFDLDLLVTVVDRSEDEVLDAVEAATATRLIDEVNQSCYRFVHALVRNALLDEISAARLGRLHRRIAEALERRRDDEPSVIAYHWVEAGSAGDEQRRIAALIAAGDRAMTRLAFVEAAEYFDRALDERRVDAGTALSTLCELLVRAGEAHAASGHYDHSRACYVECGAIAAANGLDEWIVAAGLRLSGPNAFRSTVGDDERALVALAYERCPNNDLTSRSILASRNAAVADEWSVDHRQWTQVALDFANRSGSDDARRCALSQHVLTAFYPDAIDRQLDNTDEIVTLARRSGSVEAVLEALTLRLLPLGVMARWTEHEDARAEVEREAERYGHAYYHAVAMMSHASRLSCLGRLDDAESLSAAAVGIYSGEEIAIPWVALLVQIRNLQGRLEELKSSVSERRTDVDVMPEVISSLVRAMVLALTDETEEARALLRAAAADDFAALNLPGGRGRCCELSLFAEVAAFVDERSIAEPVHALLAPYDGLQVVPSVSVSLGPVARYLGMLERLMGRDADALGHFEAAIASCDARGELSYGGLARAALVHLLETSSQVADRERARHIRDEIHDLVTVHGIGGAVRHLEALEQWSVEPTAT